MYNLHLDLSNKKNQSKLGKEIRHYKRCSVLLYFMLALDVHSWWLLSTSKLPHIVHNSLI